MKYFLPTALSVSAIAFVHAAPPAPKLPPYPWGVYAWGGKGDIPADMPIRGIPITCDAGKGGWELVYTTAKGDAVATKVALTGNGEWRDVNVTLTDAVWDHRLGGGGDLALRATDGADTTFHLIELARQ